MTTPTTTSSDALANRVRALLDKAASTNFPEEAESLLAKAQELMTRHAISVAMVEGLRVQDQDQITTRSVTLRAPYASAKGALLGAVAAANTCRAVWTTSADGARQCTVVGHAGDLDATETLYLALEMHAVRAMLAEPTPPGDTVKRFRRSFLLAFATRIGERLREANRSAVREWEHETGRSTAVVLADRKTAVDQAFRRDFPRVRTARLSASSGAGLRSGRAAADRARLGLRVLPGGRQALGRGRG